MKTKIAPSFLILLLPLVLSGCFKTRAEIAKEREEAEVRTSLQQNIVDTSQGMEKIQNDIGRLQGRIEEMEHQRKKEMSGLNSSRDNEQKSMERTLEDLRQKVGALQAAQNALFEEIKQLKEESLHEKTLGEQSRKPKAGAAGKKKPGVSTFDHALSAYKSKDYQRAADAFRAYLDANPKGRHSLDAHYYLGDSLYKEQDFAQAVVAFGVVHERSSDSLLGRKSTLRIAQSFKAMGKDRDAKAFALLLVQGSPTSAEAKKARTLLK